MSDIARRITASGRVQGVGFRHYTKLKARELGVRGYVQNLDDGSVEVWAEGAAHAVEDMLAWLSHGPPMAHVADTRVLEGQPTGAQRFEVRFEP